MADQLQYRNEEAVKQAQDALTRQQPYQKYLTLPEVAAHYRTTEGTVRYWRHCGYGPRGVKLGTRVLYPRTAIEAFDRELAQRDATGAA